MIRKIDRYRSEDGKTQKLLKKYKRIINHTISNWHSSNIIFIPYSRNSLSLSNPFMTWFAVLTNIFESGGK